MLGRISRSFWVSAASVGVSVAARSLLLAGLGTRVPWVTFFPAVIAAALFGGFASGLLATALSCASVAWLWRLFSPEPFLVERQDLLGLLIFMANGLLVSAMAMTTTRQRETAQKRALDLEASKGRLSAILECSPSGVAVLRGDDLRYEFVNPAYHAIDPRRELVGRRFSDCWPEAAAEIGPLARRVLTTGEPFHTDDAVLRLQPGPEIPAEERHFNYTMQRFPGQGQEEPALLVTALDTTGHEKTRHALEVVARDLRESERKLGLVVQHARDGISMFDLRTSRYVFASPSFVSMTGLTRSEAEGMSSQELLDHVHPDDRTRPGVPGHEAEAEASKMPIECVEYRWRTPDGSYRWFSDRLNANAGPDGEPTILVRVSRDVTGEKAGAERLAASEERFRNLAEIAPAGIFLTDPQGRNTYVNAAAEKIIGMKRDEILGFGWVPAIHPDDRERVVSEWEAAVRSRLVFESDYRFLHPDGTVVLAKGIGSAFHDAAGEITGHIGIVVDITEAERLREQVAISSRLAAIGTLVARVAHEVNNPLSATLASAGFAAETVKDVLHLLDGDSPIDRPVVARSLAEVQDALQDAMAGCERVADIVRDLAIFANPRLELRPVSLGAVTDTALRWLPPTVSLRADVEKDMQDVGDVIASEGQLSQVIVNLVNNAAKAIPPSRRGHIRIRARPGSPGTARLEVEDDGIGMSPEVLSRAFDPFFTTRPPGEGTGLGLALAHSIITAFGGTISVTSTPGRGSTFRVELPLATVNPVAGPSRLGPEGR